MQWHRSEAYVVGVRVLVVKPTALGDVVHALPFLKRLRAARPRPATIDWVIGKPFAGLLEGHPDLDALLIFEKDRATWGRLRRELRGGGYDLVIDLQGLARSGVMTRLTGAPRRVGFRYAREGATLAYTEKVGGRVQDHDRHAVDRYLDVADHLGLPELPATFDFALTDDDRRAAAELVPGGRFAVLLPGTNWATKRWPVGHFAELSKRLPVPAVICGTAGDGELARHLTGRDLTGRTTIRQLVAVLERAAVVVANDSGPMHIACALGRPLVTLFGPTDPVRTGPHGRPDTVMRVDIGCAPCLKRTCVHHTCMKALSVDAVERRVRELLPTERAGRPRSR